jgi:hypothetical protein
VIPVNLTPAAAGLMGLLTVGAAEPPPTPGRATCTCPCAPAPAGETAAGALVPRPTPAAFALNRKGRDLYRQRRFAEARDAYRAALGSDPTFVAPRLNIACAFAQEERFAEAVNEATTLAKLRYVPWAREIDQAADLAPLRVRPEGQALRAALDRAAVEWGAAFAGSSPALLYVARTAPAIRLPPAGVLLLGLAQEIFAYFPATGTHRQITAEDGRVLAFVRSPDGRAVVYLTAGKLVREPGQPDRLRGLLVRRLDLPRMALGRPFELPGDIIRVGLRFAEQSSASLQVVTADGQSRVMVFDGAALLTAPAAAHFGPPTVVLDARGVRAASSLRQSGDCALAARDEHRPGGPPAVRIEARGRKFTLLGPQGAGLAGLPFP